MVYYIVLYNIIIVTRHEKTRLTYVPTKFDHNFRIYSLIFTVIALTETWYLYPVVTVYRTHSTQHKETVYIMTKYIRIYIHNIAKQFSDLV